MKNTVSILAEGLFIGLGSIAIRQFKANPELCQQVRKAAAGLAAALARPAEPISAVQEHRLATALEALEKKLGSRQLVDLLEGVAGTAPVISAG